MVDSFTYIVSQGGVVMLPLLLCSVFGFAIIIERGVQFVLFQRKQSQKDVDALLAAIAQNNTGLASEIASNSRDAVVAMLAGVREHPKDSAQGVVDTMSGGVTSQLNRYLPVLDTIIVVAPLLGILGTVLGIIQSFDLLGSAGIQDPKAVTVGISQALITTAAGLSIAIIVIVPYHYFLRQIDRLQERMNMALSRLDIIINAR